MEMEKFVPSCRRLQDGVRPGDLFPSSVTQLQFSTTHFFFSVSFSFLASVFFSSLSPSTPQLFFFFPFSLCQGVVFCHVTFCLNTIAGACHWPIFFERALVSRVMGNGGTTSLFSAAAPLPSALLSASSLSVALSLPQAVVDQVAREHDTHRQWQGCAALRPLPLLLFRQAVSPRDHQTAGGE